MALVTWHLGPEKTRAEAALGPQDEARSRGQQVSQTGPGGR